MQRIEEMWKILLPGIMHDDFHNDPSSLSGLISAAIPTLPQRLNQPVPYRLEDAHYAGRLLRGRLADHPRNVQIKNRMTVLFSPQ